jgi:hypothetical protein
MITSAADERIKEVRTTEDELIIAFVDGRTLSVPLVWYPRLLHASPEQRSEWRLIGDGEGVHWTQIDEDLSAAGLLRGVPAVRPHRLPAKEIGDQAVRAAKALYADSVGELKSRLQNDRAQLGSLVELVPGEDVKVRIQEMVDSYIEIEGILDQTAQELGLEDVVNQAAQQAQQGAAAGEAAQQVQDVAQGAVQQAQDTAGQAVGQAQDVASGAAQQAQDTAGQAAQQAEEVGMDLSQGEVFDPEVRFTAGDASSAVER